MCPWEGPGAFNKEVGWAHKEEKRFAPPPVGADKTGLGGKMKNEGDGLAILASGAVALRCYRREVLKYVEACDGDTALKDSGQRPAALGLTGYLVLTFFLEYDQAGLDEDGHAAFLRDRGVDSIANRKIFPMLSQTALFEILADIDASRESIRRLLLALSELGLLDRVSKGPPFPDQLGLSKAGRKLMQKTAKRVAKETTKTKPFAYL